MFGGEVACLEGVVWFDEEVHVDVEVVEEGLEAGGALVVLELFVFGEGLFADQADFWGGFG